MDVAASLIAFITIGIQSTKIIYDTLSAIKDGPEVVARAAKDIQRLSTILKSLEPTCTVDPAWGQELRQHLQECTTDLRTFEKWLGKFMIDNADSRLERLCNQVKTALGKKDFSALHTLVASHIAHLNLYLQMKQGDTTFEIRKEVRVLTRTLHTSESNNEKRATVAVDKLSRIEQRVSGVDSILNGLRTNWEQRTSSLSAENQETHQLVRVLIENLNNLSTQLENKTRVVNVTNEEEDVEEVIQDPPDDPSVNLQRTISRLYEVANRELAQMYGRGSYVTGNRDVLDGLLEVFEFIRCEASQAVANSRREGWPMHRNYQQTRLQDLWCQLEPLYHALFHSRAVSLNPPTPNHQEGMCVNFDVIPPTGSATGHLGLTKTATFRTSTFTSYDSPHARMSVATSKKYKTRPGCANPGPRSQTSPPDIDEEVSYSVTWAPKGSCFMLRLKQTQYWNLGGGIPSLDINRVVPLKSPVFQVVQEGDVTGLQQLLIRGQASLRDHCEYGWSLLMQAALSQRIDMIQFLLDNGADVNHVDPGGDGIFQYLFYEDLRWEGQASVVKRLLDTGADPFLCTSDAHPIEDIFMRGDLQSIKHFCELSGLPTDLNDTSTSSKMSLFHWYCHNRDITTEGLQFLINRGADIYARDEFGRTCLHIWAKSNNGRYLRPSKGWEPMRDAIIYLIQCSKDLLWTDYRGSTLSYAAYETDVANMEFESGAVGDIWDRVLAELGEDVSEFRQSFPRQARYTDDYSPRDFMRLWQGKEHLCPYYNDDDLQGLCCQLDSGRWKDLSNEYGLWIHEQSWEFDSSSEGNFDDMDSDQGSESDSDDDNDGGAPIGSEDESDLE
ncbi:hypothetical protein BKA56DRAFT_177476 [Ilyonectria sp. MPI-CAGE-AT-0026]|nr:hypothetical protein BKA56DRAFT_177476 [Ilyonectria sp. MPI-CAGE-AT-0026]